MQDSNQGGRNEERGRERERARTSVAFLGGRRGEYELLLIGGDDFLIKVTKVLIFVLLEDCEAAGELPQDGDLAWRRPGLGNQESAVGPGDLCVFWSAFDGESGGKVVHDLISNLLGVLHIDGLKPVGLPDKGEVDFSSRRGSREGGGASK